MGHGGVPPHQVIGQSKAASFQRCVEVHNNFFYTKAAAAALRQELRRRGPDGENDRKQGWKSVRKARLARASRRGRRPTCNGDKVREGGLSKVIQTTQSAWPNKPRMEGEKFEEFCEAARKGCGESCRFFLIGRCCQKADCNRPHQVTEAFKKIQKNLPDSEQTWALGPRRERKRMSRQQQQHASIIAVGRHSEC